MVFSVKQWKLWSRGQIKWFILTSWHVVWWRSQKGHNRMAVAFHRSLDFSPLAPLANGVPAWANHHSEMFMMHLGCFISQIKVFDKCLKRQPRVIAQAISTDSRALRSKSCCKDQSHLQVFFRSQTSAKLWFAEEKKRNLDLFWFGPLNVLCKFANCTFGPIVKWCFCSFCECVCVFVFSH